MVAIKYIGFDNCYKIRVNGYLIVINYTANNCSELVNIQVYKKWGLKWLEQMVLQDTDLNRTRLGLRYNRDTEEKA